MNRRNVCCILRYRILSIVSIFTIFSLSFRVSDFLFIERGGLFKVSEVCKIGECKISWMKNYNHPRMRGV